MTSRAATTGIPPVAFLLLMFAAPGVSAQTVDPLERSANERQPHTKVMDAVGIRPGLVVGEVGAGRGRYTVFLAKRVGDTGKIYANDIDAPALAYLRERCRRDGITNVETILGKGDDARFPDATLDMVFMVWVYHMMETPVPLLRSLGPSMKPGATVVIVDPVPEEVEEEFRDATAGTRFTVPTREHVERDARLAGFELVQSMIGFLEKDNIFILRKH
jgi:ubiquinone/menaquinone biosynthesis C-methylase UbiE